MPKYANTKKYIQRICFLALFSPLLLHATNNTNPNTPTEKAYFLNDDDLLVVSVEYEDLVLEESLFVFQTPEATFIPVQGLIDTLNFALNLDLDALTIDGWFTSEPSTISIDIANQTVFIRGEKQTWPNTFKYAEDGFDLYIDHHSLESWLGLSLSLDVSQLSVQVSSDTILPIVLKKQRREQQLLTDTPTQRYESFMSEFGSVAADIPLFQIAAYLGITDVSLSRIRKRLNVS